MNPLLLLPGIAIAAAIFCAFAWVASRAFRVTGRARGAHLAAAALTIATMATISLRSPVAAFIAGLLLVTASLFSTAYEAGSARLWPLLLAAFGAIAASGLPFA